MPPPVRRRRRHLLLKILGAVALLFLAAVVAIPYIISSDWGRRRVAAAMSESMHTDVQLEDFDFGWFSGVGIDGLRIANPAGFDASHPFLQLRHMRGDLGLWQALRGNFEITGAVDGLQLFLDQDVDGRTNAEALGGGSKDGGGGGGGGNGGRPDPEMLQRLRLDLALTDSTLEIRRGGQLLESVRDIACKVNKVPGSPVFDLQLDATTDPAGGKPGKLQVHATVDSAAMTVDSDVAVARLDLAHYQPVVDVFVPPGGASIAGIVDANLQAHVTGEGADRRLVMDGSIAVEQPQFAGSLLQGMTIKAVRWSMTPQLIVALDADDMPTRIDASKFTADLGCLQLRGLDGAATEKMLGGKPGLGFETSLDVDVLASYGGPLPEQLRNVGGVVSGKVAVPFTGLQMPPLEQLLADVEVDAAVQARHLVVSGFDLSGLDASLRMQDGKLAFDTGKGTQLNTGGLQLQLQSDLQQPSALPFQLQLHWRGGKVAGETTALLRYVVPLLAGVQATAASFDSGIDLGLELKGAAMPQSGQSWLQLLNTWEGSGNIALTDGEVQPAPALQGLLSLLGQQGSLAIDRLAGGFTLKQGTIDTQLMRWISKGQDYGLSGKVRLDGKLDVGIDVTAMLQQHKDGQKVAAVLGDRKLMVGLDGTLEAPQLSLPDVGKLLAEALQQDAGQTLQQTARDALQKALDDLLKGKKK